MQIIEQYRLFFSRPYCNSVVEEYADHLMKTYLHLQEEYSFRTSTWVRRLGGQSDKLRIGGAQEAACVHFLIITRYYKPAVSDRQRVSLHKRYRAAWRCKSKVIPSKSVESLRFEYLGRKGFAKLLAFS
jgi:coproporphyrinogen III oxidase